MTDILTPEYSKLYTLKIGVFFFYTKCVIFYTLSIHLASANGPTLFESIKREDDKIFYDKKS